jgi:hypothetical protein
LIHEKHTLFFHFIGMDRANHLWPDIARLVPKCTSAVPWLYASSATVMCAPPLYTNLHHQCVALRRLRCLTSEYQALERHYQLHDKLHFVSLLDMLVWAADTGRLGVIQFLRAWAPRNGQLTIRNSLATQWAAKNGHIHVLRHFKEHWGLDSTDVANCRALTWACQNGHLHVLQFFVYELGVGPENVWPTIAFRMAAEYGHIEIMHFLRQHWHMTLKDVCDDDNYVLRMVGHHGHAHVLRFLREWRDPPVGTKGEGRLTRDDARAQNNYLMHWAAQNAYIHILEALKKDWHLTKHDLLSNDGNILITAARHGHVHVLKVCQDLWPMSPDETALWVGEAALCAAGHGQVQVLRFLRDCWHVALQDVQSRDGDTLIYRAAAAGHVDVLVFLKESGLNQEYARGSYQENALRNAALRRAAKNGHVHVLHALKDLWHLDAQDARTHENYAFRWAASGGHVKVLHFLRDQWHLDVQDARAYDNYALAWAAVHGEVNVLQFLKESFPSLTRADVCSDNNRALRWAQDRGHTQAVQFLEQWLLELS